MRYGIFLGYVTEPGCRWKGVNKIAPLEDFVGENLHQSCSGARWTRRLDFHETEVLCLAGSIQFPLFGKYEAAETTFAGQVEHLRYLAQTANPAQGEKDVVVDDGACHDDMPDTSLSREEVKGIA